MTSSELRSVARGTLKFGDVEVECHVLSDGRRVLSTKQTERAIGAAGSRDLARSLSRIPSNSGGLSVPPVCSFVLSEGGRANAYSSESVLDICIALQDALIDGTLHSAQLPAARRAALIVRACAKVGIEALIDEATGYQELRAKDHLEKRLAMFLREEPDVWKRRWTSDLIRELARLYRKELEPGQFPIWAIGIIGRLYDIFYPKDVIGELRLRNPRPQHGSNHHQFLSPDGQGLLVDDLRFVYEMARTSTTRPQFWNRIYAHFRGEPIQSEMWM